MLQLSVLVPQVEAFDRLSCHAPAAPALKDLLIDHRDLLLLGRSGEGGMGLLVPPEFQFHVACLLSRTRINGIQPTAATPREFESFQSQPLLTPTRIDLAGIDTLLLGIGAPFPENILESLLALSADERQLREREVQLYQNRAESCFCHLAPERTAFGKICLGFRMRDNTLHLYGDLRPSYAELMDQTSSQDSGSTTEEREIFRRMSQANKQLDDRHVYHINIPRPKNCGREERAQFVIVGGGNAFFDAAESRLYIAGHSGSFGPMSDKAVLNCLERAQDLRNLSLSRELVVTPDSILAVGNERLKLIEALAAN